MLGGEWLPYSKLASDTEIPKETIRRYVSLLEDTLPTRSGRCSSSG
jgi:predicted AAA+ superfamily ATPase